MHPKPILVIGGTGKTGSRILKQLQDLGVPTRVGSRKAALPFDWDDQSTWRPAIDGTSAVYIAYQPDLAVPGAVDAVREFARIALDCGVTRLVLLSGRGEDEAQRAEQVLQESGAEWTILRASWFFQNFTESFLADAVLSGTVALPVGDVLEPFIDADDIADVAVAALTKEGHVGKLYELTGPELLTFPRATELIAKANGRPVNFVPINHEQYAEGMQQQGVPEDMRALVTYLFSTVLDGRNSHIVDGVRQALGREPRAFAAYAEAAAEAGAWSR